MPVVTEQICYCIRLKTRSIRTGALHLTLLLLAELERQVLLLLHAAVTAKFAINVVYTAESLSTCV